MTKKIEFKAVDNFLQWRGDGYSKRFSEIPNNLTLFQQACMLTELKASYVTGWRASVGNYISYGLEHNGKFYTLSSSEDNKEVYGRGIYGETQYGSITFIGEGGLLKEVLVEEVETAE